MLNSNEILEVGILLLDGYPYREITASHRIGDHTLVRFKKTLINHGIDVISWNALNDDQRYELCYPTKVIKQDSDELFGFEAIYRKLQHRGSHYSIKMGWIEYIKKNPDGLRYSQFCSRYRQWESITHPGRLATAPVNRKPGKYLFIDWIGDQPSLVMDPDHSGKKIKAHFLVFTMGYSSKTFAAAYPDEKTESVIDGINRALCFLGALPQAFRPDNMKTAVQSNTREGIVLSTAMEDLQNFYDVPVLPARPLSFKDKASVERAVQILEVELLPHLESKTFFSFSELNKEIMLYLEELNTRIKTDEILSRNELFKMYDLPNMKALPQTLFCLPEYKRLKVQRNCHIKFGGIYYSVPYRHVGQSVIVKRINDHIEICTADNQLICTHNRPVGERQLYVTQEDHLKSNYQISRRIERRGVHEYLDRASKIGPQFRAYMEKIIASCKYEEQSYGTCSGLLHKPDGYPKDLAEMAAAECLKSGIPGYNRFCTVFDRLASENNVKPKSSKPRKKEKDKIPEHANIRGKDYYQ